MLQELGITYGFYPDTGGNIQDLLDVSSQLIKNNTVVVDPALRLLAYTKDVPCDDPVTVELIKHGYHTEENIRQFKLHKRFQPWATQDGLIINDSHQICKYTTVVKSFKTKNSYSIIVIMMCNQVKEPEDFLLDTLAILLKRIEVYALKEYPADKPSGNTVDTFLRDLIENKVFHETTIVERSQFVGIPFKSSFCLFYIDLGENPNYPIARLLSQVAKNVAPAKTLSYDDAIIVLCFNCQRNSCGHTCARGTCVSEKKTITARLTEILSEYGLSCGRSSMFYKLSDTHIAFLQAREAASLQHVSLRGEDELSSSEGQKVQIASFDNHYLAFMIDRSSVDGEDLIAATSAQRLLHQIKDYDDEHNTDNFFFLHQYLLHERRASVVADILHMHRNNVKYRIDRIEELFDIQCDNADLRLELLFAYEIFSIGSASVYE